MRILALALLCASLLACGSSDTNTGDDDVSPGATDRVAADAGGVTSDAAYTALFDADATVSTRAGLPGLWQLKGIGGGANIRIRFTETDMLVGVRWREATFGVTTGYQLKGTDSRSVELVVAREVAVTGEDGTGATFQLTVKSGIKTARFAETITVPATTPHKQRWLELGTVYETVFLAAPNSDDFGMSWPERNLSTWMRRICPTFSELVGGPTVADRWVG